MRLIGITFTSACGAWGPCVRLGGSAVTISGSLRPLTSTIVASEPNPPKFRFVLADEKLATLAFCSGGSVVASLSRIWRWRNSFRLMTPLLAIWSRVKTV